MFVFGTIWIVFDDSILYSIVFGDQSNPLC